MLGSLTVKAEGLNDVLRDWNTDYSTGLNYEVEEDSDSSRFLELISMALSAGVIVIVGLQFVQTTIDLLYIGVVPIRPLLWSGGGNNPVGLSGNTTQSNMGVHVQSANNPTVTPNVQKEDKEKKPLISDSLRRTMKGSTGLSSSQVAKLYLKDRVIIIILIIICVMLLVVSNVIYETGWNVAFGILKLFGLS